MTKHEQQLQRQLDEALDRIARLESRPPSAATPCKTPYERFLAQGRTHRDWVRYRRQLERMQNHY